MESKFLPTARICVVNGKEIEVKPLALRKYKELIEKIAEVLSIADMSLLGSVDSRQIFEKVKDAPEKLAKICEIATGISENEVLDGSLEEAMGLIGAAIEVNKISTVFADTLKKIKGPAKNEATTL